jgi:hypothetical protein
VGNQDQRIGGRKNISLTFQTKANRHVKIIQATEPKNEAQQLWWCLSLTAPGQTKLKTNTRRNLKPRGKMEA